MNPLNALFKNTLSMYALKMDIPEQQELRGLMEDFEKLSEARNVTAEGLALRKLLRGIIAAIAQD